MPSVLFVCTANQFRSPIAAACLRKLLEKGGVGGHWVIESAGTWAEEGLPAADVAIKVAKQLGLNELQTHRTRRIDQDILDRYDLIIVMEAGHKEALVSEFPHVRGRVHLLSEIVDEISYDIPDPAYHNVNPIDIGRDILDMITRGREEILQLAQDPGKGD